MKLNGHTDMTDKDDECELGYWSGQPFGGKGLIPEAAKELLRHAFEDLKMNVVWCGYYAGNMQSKRVQEKLGFVYHHTCNEVPVPLINDENWLYPCDDKRALERNKLNVQLYLAQYINLSILPKDGVI